MAWNPEYTKELNSIMDEWENEIQEEIKKGAPSRGTASGSRSKTDIINIKYREMLDDLKKKHGMV